MARLMKELQAEMRDTLLEEAVVSFKRDWERNPTEEHLALLGRHVDTFVTTLDTFLQTEDYPTHQPGRPYGTSLNLEEQGWLRRLTDAFYEALPEEERHLSVALTDSFGEDALAPRFDGLGAVRRWVFRFGIGDAGVSEVNMLDESHVAAGDKEAKWRRLMALATVKKGSPVSVSADGFGWREIGYAADHLKECAIVHVSVMDENESWSEFVDTFSTEDSYAYGVGLYGCHCECRRWVGDVRWETQGLRDPLHAVLEVAGLL